MIIIINNGDIFEGTLEQFKDCFFDNATEETVQEWCEQEGYSLRIETRSK